MADFYIAQGDTASPIADVLKDSAGLPVDIQAATVTLTIFPAAGGAAIVNNVAAANNQNGNGVADGSKGKVSFSGWTSGQTGTPGDYLGVWKVTFAGGSVQTYPNGGYILIAITATSPIATATRFASSSDLAARLGLDFTADEHVRAAKLLADASGLIQDETAQTIALVTGDVYTRPGDYDTRIRLPQRPVVSVASVVLNGVTLNPAQNYYLERDELVRLNWNSIIQDSSFGLPWAGWGFPWWNLVVTYTHGFQTIPKLVKDTCLEMATRVFVNPGAVIQEAIAGTQTTYAPYSAPPRGLMLTEAEKNDLNKLLRRHSGSIGLR